jgi:glycosyltransferase involved in cell wall biosynthesis
VALRVLIISSYRINCGIASYSEVLRTRLDREFEVTIAPLDQEILRRTEPHVITAGDEQIKGICASFKDYDVVNLQWEPGLLGGRQTEQAKRFSWILEAAENLILTVHTAVPYPKGRGPRDFIHFVRKTGLRRFYRFFFEGWFERQTYQALNKRLHAGGNFIVATHTERERNFFKNVVGAREVFDHPLCHLREGWREKLTHDGPLARKELTKVFPQKRTFIGIFGFLSEYKGTLAALKAMKHLDDSYHLLVYGGVHPENIRQNQQINPYVRQLLGELVGAAPQPQVQEKKGSRNSKSDTAAYTDMLPDNQFGKSELLEKVSFLGAPRDDYDFALAISAVDICVFPYLETGQSGSGPASHAIELGKPTVLTRTKAFLELERYFPNHFELVDVGNYIQLAQAIQRLSAGAAAKTEPQYNSSTLASFYGDLIRQCAGQPPLLEEKKLKPARLKVAG